MRSMRLWTGCVLALIAAPLAAQGQPASDGRELDAVSQPDAIDGTTQEHEIAFKRDRHERLTVPVRLSGVGPFRFLVDTGAEKTAISTELAAALDLESGETAMLHSVTGAAPIATVMVPRLQMNHKQMSVDDAPLLRRSNIGADGILGVDSLRSQRILFDFREKTLSIVPAAIQPSRYEEGTIVITARQKKGRLLLTKARADDQRVTVVLDTGSEVSIGNEALRRRLVKSRMLRRSGPVEILSVTGEKLMGQYTFVEELEIGGVKLKNLAIVFADAHTFDQLGLDNRPALLLGMNAMRAFDKVSIDFANSKLRLMLPETGSLDQRRMAKRYGGKIVSGL